MYLYLKIYIAQNYLIKNLYVSRLVLSSDFTTRKWKYTIWGILTTIIQTIKIK